MVLGGIIKGVGKMPKRNTAGKSSNGKKKAWVSPVIKEIVIEETTQLAACGKAAASASPCYSCSGNAS